MPVARVTVARAIAAALRKIGRLIVSPPRRPQTVVGYGIKYADNVRRISVVPEPVLRGR
jgi:hypothetical protein